MLSTDEIREKFLAFFEEKKHTRVASSSLVPHGDPTLLFSNAGMNQFKDTFLGAEQRPYTRATTAQKCLRISGKHNDFENVGVTARHHTFFEMLGNFSFGDYFKEDAISFAWEFVTERLGLAKSRLWITIFEEDDEAGELWKKLTDVDSTRIVKLGESENFWSMGEVGPCGPCTEMHYYLGKDESKQTLQGLVEDDGSFVEIWNLVFMQFNRLANGSMEPLPKPSVDTGAGLERVALACQGVNATFDTDLVRSLIRLTEELSGHAYDGTSYAVRDLRSDINYARDVAMRVIADHSRSMAFLIADGVSPSSDGRGYVLRRVIRRAIRHGRVLEFNEPFLARTTAQVVELYGNQYPELKERAKLIERLVHAEETKFHETLDAGLGVLQKEVAKINSGKFPGEVAFLLHDTYGFPLDLTQDALKAHKMEVDEKAFHSAMEEQKRRSREDRKSQGIVFIAPQISGEPTEFVGYQHTSLDSEVTAIFGAQDGVTKISAGEDLGIVSKATPFYAESGGQVGDAGTIQLGDATIEVVDTQKAGKGYFVHYGRVLEGEVEVSQVGQKAELRIDERRRRAIRLNHSATHIVHAALRKFLGDHIKQAGSRVDERSLRFDYTHFEAVSPEQLLEMQEFVNEEVRSNHEVTTRVMPIDEARKTGAVALFGEKYGELVRVVEIGPNSLELCGGTHASRSGDIGFVLIDSESGISAGVRRIECYSGPGAYKELVRVRNGFSQVSKLLKGDGGDLVERVEKLMLRGKSLERELEEAKGKIASASSGELLDKARTSPGGIKVIAEVVDTADSDTLRGMVDRLRLKLGSGVVALASKDGDKGLIVAGVTKDLLQQVNAGNLVKEAAKASGGKGGGRADFAQAGGVDGTKLNDALKKVFELVA